MNFDRRINAKNTSGRIVFQSPDTDVMVLLLHYVPQMQAVSEVWMENGRITRTPDLRRMIPIHDISNSLGTAICTILPEVHSLTGCDTVSYFYGVGKKTVMQLVLKKPSTEFAHLEALSRDDEITAVDASRHFIASAYDHKDKFKGTHTSLNKLCVRLAATRSVPIAKLPPCEDSSLQHVKRATWQTKIQTSAHLSKPEVPSPVGHGWKMQDDIVVPVFFENQPWTRCKTSFVAAWAMPNAQQIITALVGEMA